MNRTEFYRVILASAILGLLMLSSSGAMFATYTLLVLYTLIAILFFLGISMLVADYTKTTGKDQTSRSSTFIMQCIHVVAVAHLYFLGFTIFALPIITLLSINMLSTILKKEETS